MAVGVVNVGYARRNVELSMWAHGGVADNCVDDSWLLDKQVFGA